MTGPFSCWGDCKLRIDNCKLQIARWPHAARWLAGSTRQLVFFHRAPEREPHGGGRPGGVCGPGLEAGAGRRSPCGVSGSGLNRSRRIVRPDDGNRRGHRREKPLRPGEKGGVKSEPFAAQRLTMKKPQNRLEKIKPLRRLDLRRNCRPPLAPWASRRASDERIQTAVHKQLTTRNEASFSPNRSVERISNRPGRLSINDLAIRTCDAKSEGHRP